MGTTKVVTASHSCVLGGTKFSQVSLPGNLTRLMVKMVLVPANNALTYAATSSLTDILVTQFL